MYEDITDKRPINAGEARRGLEFVKEHWSAEAQAELRELPADEAAVMLMLAGELGAVPVAAGELEQLIGEETAARPLVVIESTPKARATDPATSQAASLAVRIKAQSSKAALLLAHYDSPSRDLTDEEAATLAGIPLTSEYATRCSELRSLGLLEETGRERQGRAGMARMTSTLTSAGAAYVEEAGWRTSTGTLW